MEFLKKDFKYIALLFVFFLINISLFYGHITNVYMDAGREFYFPMSILNGEVLYKDIFNIFGPFSYLFNALLFKIFGIKFTAVYGFAAVNSFLIIMLTYLISKRFLSRFCSFAVSLLCLFAGCHSLGFSTFLLPYTYAIVYGTTFSLLCIYLFLKFLDTNKKIFLYFAFLMSGFAVSNKYEFFVLPVILLLTLFIYKKQDVKTYILNIALTSLPIVVLFSILFVQGLNFSDLNPYFHLLFAYAKSLPLKILYINIGVYPSIISAKECLLSFIVLVLTLAVLFRCFKVKHTAFRIIVMLFALLGIFAVDILFSLQRIFAAIVLINTVLALIFSKKILARPDLFFIVCASILLSLKSYWRMIAFGGYGLFIINLNLIVFLYILENFVFKTQENKTAFKRAFCANLFIVMFLVLAVNLNVLSQTKNKVHTQNTSFSTELSTKQEFDEIVSFIKNNVKKDESVIILPEGLFLNFSANAKTDNYYNIFTPDRLEAYGEQNVIKHFEKTKPDYFILMDTDYILYGTKNLCRDFGSSLCRYIGENYKLEKAVKYERSLLFFKKI